MKQDLGHASKGHNDPIVFQYISVQSFENLGFLTFPEIWTSTKQSPCTRVSIVVFVGEEVKIQVE